MLLTGDNERAASTVAQRVGIERVLAGVLADGKAHEVILSATSSPLD